MPTLSTKSSSRSSRRSEKSSIESAASTSWTHTPKRLYRRAETREGTSALTYMCRKEPQPKAQWSSTCECRRHCRFAVSSLGPELTVCTPASPLTAMDRKYQKARQVGSRQVLTVSPRLQWVCNAILRGQHAHLQIPRGEDGVSLRVGIIPCSLTRANHADW